MGLSRRLAAPAVRRSHALLVEVPGWWAARVAAEREVLRRGWRPALSPADADVLVVCGEPGDRLAAAVDRVWDQLPGPRARVAVPGTDATAALDEAAARLGDTDGQRADALGRPDPLADRNEGEMAPEGIPLADGADDRDGLEMDVLHVPLGPVLPHWPAGLVLHCVLQGDVVAEAGVEVLGGHRPPATVLPTLRAASTCDDAARLLAVAGWEDAAAAARRVRDLVLTGSAQRDEAQRDEAAARLERLRSKVGRSWAARWLLGGLGRLDEGTLRELGLPPDARGDVHDRLVAMLARARAELLGDAEDHPGEPGATLDALPRIVAGLELGAARLVVASLAPDTANAARSERTRA